MGTEEKAASIEAAISFCCMNTKMHLLQGDSTMKKLYTVALAALVALSVAAVAVASEAPAPKPTTTEQPAPAPKPEEKPAPGK
jgi:hypothetical protein